MICIYDLLQLEKQIFVHQKAWNNKKMHKILLNKVSQTLCVWMVIDGEISIWISG